MINKIVITYSKKKLKMNKIEKQERILEKYFFLPFINNQKNLSLLIEYL